MISLTGVFIKYGKVSIILPCYNHVAYISEAIESVLNQTYANFELIILDNASTDGTKEIVAEYEKKDERIRAVYHDKNIGFTRSINEGFSLATGQLISIQNSDDNWHDDKLMQQVSVFERNPNVGIVVADATIIDKNGQSFGYTFAQENRWTKFGFITDAFKELCVANFCCHSSLIFTRSCLSFVGFYDESLQYACDWWFLINAAKKYGLYFIESPLLDYRVHPANFTRNKPVVYTDMMMIRKRIADMGIDCGNNLYFASIYASLIGNMHMAKKLASDALAVKTLGLKRRLLMEVILRFDYSGKVLLKLNQIRRMVRGIIKFSKAF